jgi:uncharacterized protein
MPYGSARFSALRDIRCAQQVGLGAEALAAIAGGQLDRILEGQEPAELGPAPGFAGLGRRDLKAERGIAYLATACQLAFRGLDPTEPLSLARLAVHHSSRDHVHAADDLVEQALGATVEHPLDPRAGLYAAMAAQLVLGTPAAS